MTGRVSAPRSRPTARASSPRLRTRPRASGTRAPGKPIGPPLKAMSDRSWPPRSTPTARASSPRLRTRRRASGTRARAADRVLAGHDGCVFTAPPFARRHAHRHRVCDRTARDLGRGGGPTRSRRSQAMSARSWAPRSPDGARIVTASEDKTARDLGRPTGQPIGCAAAGHEDYVVERRVSARRQPHRHRVV